MAMELLLWAAITAAGLLFKFRRREKVREAAPPAVSDPRRVANQLANLLRMARIVTAAMLASVAMLAVVARLVQPEGLGPLDATIGLAIFAAAFFTALTSLGVHKLMVEPAAEALRLRLDDEGARGRWQQGKVLAATTAEAVALFGFVAQFLGLEPRQAIVFYAGAALLLVFHFPRRDGLPLEEAERQAALSPAQRIG